MIDINEFENPSPEIVDIVDKIKEFDRIMEMALAIVDGTRKGLDDE